MNQINIGWNLGNHLDCYNEVNCEIADVYEQFRGNPSVTKEMITDIHKAGFNTIRIPVTWDYKFEEDNHIKDFWIERVQEVVDYAYNDGMYVILDSHHDTNHGWVKASEESYTQYHDRFVSMWFQSTRPYMMGMTWEINSR